MATLKELSDRTGYSPATISRILTGDPSLTVSDEARKRVLEEAGVDWEGRVLVVSNGFHLARVRMLANRHGLGQVSTLAAPSSDFGSRIQMYIREPQALVKSFLFDRQE